ncbi:hypothetical protein AMELA_G00064550 [Ameiurus melas]|uniref:Uncharacterized protein n=1 Tax=Ameiurus melas TaxID=219545 RepID=A0A7J6B4H1_AMEME|nr:hypothetical protein AMELA_G00064550 [Ameiurus melas]
MFTANLQKTASLRPRSNLAEFLNKLLKRCCHTNRLQLTRSSHRLGRDLSSHLSELSDLVELVPDNGGEMTRDWEPNPARSSTSFSVPVERISTPHTNTHHRNKDKRLRVTVPLDRIGSLYLSGRKSRKDEPEE